MEAPKPPVGSEPPLFARIHELNALSLILEAKALPGALLALLSTFGWGQQKRTKLFVNRPVADNLSTIVDVKCPRQFPARARGDYGIQVGRPSGLINEGMLRVSSADHIFARLRVKT